MDAQEVLKLYSTGHRDFSHVSLVQVCLTNAKLIGVKLMGAESIGADLRGVDLTKAHLRGRLRSQSCRKKAPRTYAVNTKSQHR